MFVSKKKNQNRAAPGPGAIQDDRTCGFGAIAIACVHYDTTASVCQTHKPSFVFTGGYRVTVHNASSQHHVYSRV